MMLPSWHVVILALAWCLSLGVAFVAGVAAAIVFVAEVTFLTFAKILHRWAAGTGDTRRHIRKA